MSCFENEKGKHRSCALSHGSLPECTDICSPTVYSNTLPHSFTRSEGYSWALGCINSKKESRGYNLWQTLLAMSDFSDLDF